jgi:hypothetical protein
MSCYYVVVTEIEDKVPREKSMKELLLYQTKKTPDVPIFSDAYCILYTSAGSRGWVQGSKGRSGCQHHACFATTRMIPRNWMHDSDVLRTWFFFNVHTRISLIFTQCTIKLISERCTGNRWLNPFAEIQRTPLTWRVSILLMVANPHPLWSLVSLQRPHPLTLHPFPLTPSAPLHYIQWRHQQSRSSLSGTMLMGQSNHSMGLEWKGIRTNAPKATTSSKSFML